jgi:hypothetical protein
VTYSCEETTAAMVKIKFSFSKKKYLKGKRIYQHKRGHLPVPSKILKKLEPYFKENFEVEVADNDDRVALIYTYWKKEKQIQITSNRDHSL